MLNKFLSTTVLIGLLMLIGSGCDDSPTDPDDNGVIPGEPRHYQLLTVIKEVQGDFLTVFDVPADTIIDTVNIGSAFDQIAISPDLSRIFASSSSNKVTVIYSTDSLTIDTVLQGKFGKYFIDEVRNLAVAVTTSGFTTFSLFPFVDNSSATSSIHASSADIDGGLLYLSGPGSSWINRYDYTNGQLLDSTFIADDTGAALTIQEMLVLPDQNRIYMYVSGLTADYAIIWDMLAGSIVSQIPHAVADGKFLRSADLLSVYKSNFDLSGAQTGTTIWQYDVATDQVVDSFSTVIGSGQNVVFSSVSDIAITADNRFLYSSGIGTSLFDGLLIKHPLDHSAPSKVFTDLQPQGGMLLILGPELPVATAAP